MKLLSMKVDGEDRAGFAQGEEVLDVTAFYQLYGFKFERDYRVEESVKFRDAMELLQMGLDWLNHVAWILEAYSLHEEAKRAGVIKPLAEVNWNPPVLRPG